MIDADVARLRLSSQGITLPEDPSPEAVVTRLGAVQAQDQPGALWSIGLRMASATRADVERAIVDRTIVRTWPMRGTLHFVPAVDARWMLALLAPRVIAGAAGRHRQLELDDAAFKRSRTLLGRALKAQPVATRAALFAALERGGVATAGQRGLHILQRLSMEGMLCYGPHDDKQPTFALFDDWIPRSRALDRDDALRTIAERYFGGHGPASLRDFAGWTGLTMADARRALALARPSLQPVDADGGEMWMSAGVEMARPSPSTAFLLPGFDEFLLGYKDRSAMLSAPHAGRIVPGGNGMFLSTLVLDGQVVGTWRRSARAKSMELEATSFIRISAAQKRAFAVPAERYAHFLGIPVRLTWAD